MENNQTVEQTASKPFEGWVILELMGHRKLGGFLKEETLFGVNYVRIDVIDTSGRTVATQFYSPSAIYCITPVTSEVAIAYGGTNQPQPVSRWELPAAASIESRNYDHEEEEDNELY